MLPVAQRVDVVEDRLDGIEGMVERFAAGYRPLPRTGGPRPQGGPRGVGPRRAMNKQWSDLATKMGTVAEDIVAPSVRRMARELFDCGEQHIDAVRGQSSA